MLTENVKINIKNKVKEIIDKRQKYIEKISEEFMSNPLILDTTDISTKFSNWLIKKEAIIKDISEKKILKKKTKRKKEIFSMITKKTNEYKIIQAANFRSKSIRLSYEYDNEVRPYGEHGRYHEMIDLNSENWRMVKNVLDNVSKFIPIYVNEYYEKEFKRLCPKVEHNICEKCGSSNNKCSKFCNDCGIKL